MAVLVSVEVHNTCIARKKLEVIVFAATLYPLILSDQAYGIVESDENPHLKQNLCTSFAERRHKGL